jgi:uncharacterized protein (TIRG00374 family)
MKLKKLSLLLGALLVIILIFYFSDYKEIIGYVKVIPIFYLFGAFAVLFAAVIFRAWRWRILIGRKVGFFELTKIQFIGLMFNRILPSKMGALFKTHYLKKTANTSYGFSFGTVFAENLVEISFVIVSCFIATLLLPTRSLEVERMIWIVFFVFAASAALFILFIEYFPLERLFRKLLGLSFIKRRLKKRKTSFKHDFRKYMFSLRPKKILKAYFASIFIWAAISSANIILIKGLEVNIPLIYVYLISTLPFIVGMISLVPGGLGFQEFTVVGILFGIGVPVSLATTIALLFRVVEYALFIIFGSFSYSFLDEKPKEILPANN